MTASDMRWLRGLLSGIVVLLAIIAIELSALTAPMQAEARAQLANPAAERQELLEVQRNTQSLVESLLNHVRSQVIKVQIVGTDKDSGKPSAPNARPLQKPPDGGSK